MCRCCQRWLFKFRNVVVRVAVIANEGTVSQAHVVSARDEHDAAQNDHRPRSV